jgi:transcriptional regulator with XRE-family HTH domain
VAGRVPKRLKRSCDTPAKALGAVITGLRLAKGWSYHKVAADVDCDSSYMNAIEHGRQNPTFSLLKAIADVHKTKLSLIFARAERLHVNCPKKKA